LRTTTIPISGLHHAACILTTPGSIPPITETHAGSLLTCWLGVGQVGLEPLRLSPTGSQQRVSRTLANPIASGFPWREHALAGLLCREEALMRLVGFNAQQVCQGMCQRGASKRQGERSPGPMCPDTVAKHIVK
jgi:hypothetical protein